MSQHRTESNYSQSKELGAFLASLFSPPPSAVFSSRNIKSVEAALSLSLSLYTVPACSPDLETSDGNSCRSPDDGRIRKRRHGRQYRHKSVAIHATVPLDLSLFRRYFRRGTLLLARRSELDPARRKRPARNRREEGGGQKRGEGRSEKAVARIPWAVPRVYIRRERKLDLIL